MVPSLAGSEKFVICGFGAATPVGATGPMSAAAVRLRVSHPQEHPEIYNMYGELAIVHRATYLDDSWPAATRMSALAGLAYLLDNPRRRQETRRLAASCIYRLVPKVTF